MRSRPKPNARWVCGYQAIGNACEEGPSDKGVCCQRKRSRKAKDSSKTKEPSCETDCGCAETCELAGLRREPSLPSHEQLGPCIPRKTDWFSRQSIALNAAVLTGGILLLCMALPVREQVFVPGGLSSKHSQILGNRLVSERCSQCHSPVHGTFIESLTGNFAGEVQDDKCMNCHQSHMPDAGRRSPHDLTGEELQLISWSFKGVQRASLESQTTHCASCHVEHHGAEHKIASMADARCQACHQKQFESLASGHPEFDGFPYRSRRSIKFDHNTHSQKHFSSKSQSFECRNCHIQSSGEKDGVFRTLGFEQACASCHAEPIRAAAVGGWALLQLPSLETETASRVMPFWPEGALYGFDGQVTPVMQTLLSDAGQRDLFRDLPSDRQLASIESKKQQADTATAVAIGVRELIIDVAEGGQSAWRSRLVGLAEAKLGRPLELMEHKIVDEMTAGLPPDLFQQMAQRWLQPVAQVAKKVNAAKGRLISQSDDDLLLGTDQDEEELLGSLAPSARDAQSRANKPINLARIKGAKHLTAGGWYLDEQLYALRYMPRGHGDLTMAAWAQYLKMLASEGQGMLSVGDAMLDNCLECHQLDGIELAGWADWKAKTRPSGARLFTKFDHSPHLTLPAVNDCKYCHQLDATAIDSSLQPVASKTGSVGGGVDFVPMKLQQCSACHQKGGAKDGCTTCHNYHVGSIGLEWSRLSSE